MTSTLNRALTAAVLQILRPLARLLLSHGTAYGNFADLARRAYVDEAYAYLERTGKRPTISSAAALTGLTRKEVKRLREEALSDDEEGSQKYNRAIRVISGWISDSDFHDDADEPAVLPFAGEGGSFTALVKKYSGDIPPAAMLSLLEKSSNVVSVDGNIELRERAYIPMATPVEKINILGTDVGELIQTIGHNIQAAPEHRFFQRKVSHIAVSAEALSQFREMSAQKSQQLLEEYHAWLSANEIENPDADDAAAFYVAVGIYYFERPE